MTATEVVKSLLLSCRITHHRYFLPDEIKKPHRAFDDVPFGGVRKPFDTADNKEVGQWIGCCENHAHGTKTVLRIGFYDPASPVSGNHDGLEQLLELGRGKSFDKLGNFLEITLFIRGPRILDIVILDRAENQFPRQRGFQSQVRTRLERSGVRFR